VDPGTPARAGLLKKATSGAYRVTDPGAEALTGQPKRIDICFLERYPAYVEWRRHIIELGQEAAQEARG
jgi:restriction endonuclease Mrr